MTKDIHLINDTEDVTRITFHNYPIVSPCQVCGSETYLACASIPEACQKLWDFLAERGDWIMEQNKKTK